jgi:hypothetical protein
MVALRVRSSFAVALIAVVAVVLLALAAPAGAAASRGSVTIHSRICPTTPPPLTNLFNQCHHRPGPDGASFRLDNRQSKPIAANGNVSFGRATVGTHTVFLTSDFQPNEFLRLRVFCSSNGGTAVERSIRHGDQASFRVYVGAGAKVVCDVYFIPISGR